MKKIIFCLTLALFTVGQVFAQDFSNMSVRLSILQDEAVQSILNTITKEYFVDQIRLTRPSQVSNKHVLRVTWAYKQNSGAFCYDILTDNTGLVSSISEQRDCR